MREKWVDCIFLDCKKRHLILYIPYKRLGQKLEVQAGITGNILWWIKKSLRERKLIVEEEMSE